MDHINKVLTTSSGPSSHYSLAIRAALTLRKRTMDKYHKKTGESEVYRIAMGKSLSLCVHYTFLTVFLVLHPCNKLEYFRRNHWDDESIEATRDIVQDEFDRTYWSMDGEDGTKMDIQTQTHAPPEPTNMFDTINDITPPPSTSDELQRYLASDVEDVKDALKWWHERCKTFPELSRMACDYLSIPGEFS